MKNNFKVAVMLNGHPKHLETTQHLYKHWNNLLGSSTSTSQQIIDNMFSGSLGGIKLPIDYSGFQNFVFYSSIIHIKQITLLFN